MKRSTVLVHTLIFFIFLCAALSFAPAARAQTVGYAVEGAITRQGVALTNVEVVLTFNDTGHAYKTRTGAGGHFSMVGLPLGSYVLTVLNEKGEEILRQPQTIGAVGRSTTVQPILLDITAEGKVNKVDPAFDSKPRKMTKEEIKAEQEKVKAMNGLIMRAQEAMRAKNWPEAEKLLQEVLAENPNTTRWELFWVLGDAQSRSNKLEDAIKSYQKGIDIAQAVAAGTAAKDLRNPNPDPNRAKAGAGQMMTSMGNAYVRSLGSSRSPVLGVKRTYRQWARTAESDPNPAVAYYNLCAVEYNMAKFEAAAAACGKSLDANPSKADAWFFKGAALKSAGKPGATEALKKYLELEANGAYSDAAKSLLQQKQ